MKILARQPTIGTMTRRAWYLIALAAVLYVVMARVAPALPELDPGPVPPSSPSRSVPSVASLSELQQAYEPVSVALPRLAPLPAATPRPPAPFVLRRLRGAASPSAASVRSVLSGLQRFDAYTRRTLGTSLRGRTTVVIAVGDTCLTPRDGHDGEAWEHTICVFADPIPGPLLIAHEAAHVLLNTEAGCLRPGEHQPRWLIEGMAEDVAYRAAYPHTPQSRLRHDALVRARNERASGQSLSYGDAMARVMDVEAGRPRRLVAFCQAVAASGTLQSAARRIFGRRGAAVRTTPKVVRVG